MPTEYSIWLVPEGKSPEHEFLEGLIREYTEQYDDAPIFEPHVTVISGVVSAETAGAAAAHVAEDRGAVDIKLSRPHCSTTHFQCVYLLAEPTREILELRLDAAEAYGTETGMYVPHLSLVYSDMPVSERRQILEEFDTSALPLSFTAKRLLLVDTTDDAGDWKVLSQHDLG